MYMYMYMYILYILFNVKLNDADAASFMASSFVINLTY